MPSQRKMIRWVCLLAILGLATTIPIQAGEWSGAPSLNTPRTGATAVVWDHSILVFGGLSLNGLVVNTVEMYNPALNTWDAASVDSFGTARTNAHAIVFDGKIYLIGGDDGAGSPLGSVEIFNPSSGTWNQGPDLLESRTGHITGVLNADLWTLAGQDLYGEAIAHIEYLTLASGSWQQASTQLSQPKVAPFSITHNDTLYISGGFELTPTGTGVKAYSGTEPGTLEWGNLPVLDLKRGDGATAIFDNKIYMIGGNTLDGPTDAVETYDLATALVEYDEPLPNPLVGSTAVTLGDTMYVIGGHEETPNVPLDDVLIYTEFVINIDADPTSRVPEEYIVISGFPNPFNGIIQLSTRIPSSGPVQLDVYNIEGRHLKSIHRGQLVSGTHHFSWDGSTFSGARVSSGVYLIRLATAQETRSLKVFYTQ